MSGADPHHSEADRFVALTLGSDGADELQAAVTRIYLAILQQPDPSKALLVAQGLPAAVVDEAVEALVGRGLLSPRPDGGFEPIRPDVALPAHATTLERRARGMRAAAHELTQVFFQARAAGSQAQSEDLRLLNSLDEIHSATAEVVASASTAIRAVRDLSARTEVVFAAPLAEHRRRSYGPEGTELTVQSVYDAGVLDLPGAATVLEARTEGGERQRFAHDVPFTAVVVDQSAALVDVSSYDQSGAGSMLVRSRPLVHALAALVEGSWRRAVPLPQIREGGPERRDLLILTMLAAGASDATIARQAGISQRTVERRVRMLLDRLGAGTRFQAGVQAVRRGWI